MGAKLSSVSRPCGVSAAPPHAEMTVNFKWSQSDCRFGYAPRYHIVLSVISFTETEVSSLPQLLLSDVVAWCQFSPVI